MEHMQVFAIDYYITKVQCLPTITALITLFVSLILHRNVWCLNEVQYIRSLPLMFKSIR